MVKKHVINDNNLKTKEDRVLQVLTIRKKLNNLGLSPEIEGIKEFNNICKDYVNLGYSWSGKIKLYGTKRILSGKLPMKKNIDCFIELNYDKNV